MSMLSFGVSYVLFVFNIILTYISALIKFSKCSLSFFLKIMIFPKNFFKVLLCCDFFVACAVLLA
jgi:hypothetical protein